MVECVEHKYGVDRRPNAALVLGLHCLFPGFRIMLHLASRRAPASFTKTLRSGAIIRRLNAVRLPPRDYLLEECKIVSVLLPPPEPLPPRGEASPHRSAGIER